MLYGEKDLKQGRSFGVWYEGVHRSAYKREHETCCLQKWWHHLGAADISGKQESYSNNDKNLIFFKFVPFPLSDARLFPLHLP